ncbi:3-methyl-2-oxobutanoate hydroxymethyltransferase [Candidatus Pandoraea novymonadis]|uniref:3-methyl-2-oxobutanoate hydroxymethyltransferase n=1 Tax=Candidatus Pandoraea novymonadis TaxID=1808959 RepID=A0ABX5FDS9_9BURK|nr:3-methyl-2-oxobutanoate hydroxymethyltransferase [Candidatus Pandoraea novymonadis]PSB91880.1 3-methyl-2-oxobutanoate hydroxymethyltransferase [Candidatus Pandoraea novymonadis]
MNYLKTSNRCAITVPGLADMRSRGEKIAMLTCYDASFATLCDQNGVDTLLIGDSLGNVLQGHRTTLSVTLRDIAYHTESVAKKTQIALIISDLPFGTYGTPQQAYHSAVELMRAGAQMVKLEGGAWLAETVRFLFERGIPVCTHLGLTPQSIHAFGGFKVQGRDKEAGKQLLEDAHQLENAGAQLMVLEAIPATLAEQVTLALSIPTIGIGAGPNCSGQVLVLHDLLGVYTEKRPRFVKNFIEGQPSIAAAVQAYVSAVKEARFPAPEHCF